MQPRLLNQENTAKLLGSSRSWFIKHRAQLERMGFPLPALSNDLFGAARWDAVAINTWLDSLMPNALRNNMDIKNHLNDFDQDEIDAQLAAKASEIANGGVYA